jgi:hypothetical protein
MSVEVDMAITDYPFTKVTYTAVFSYRKDDF